MLLINVFVSGFAFFFFFKVFGLERASGFTERGPVSVQEPTYWLATDQRQTQTPIGNPGSGTAPCLSWSPGS